MLQGNAAEEWNIICSWYIIFAGMEEVEHYVRLLFSTEIFDVARVLYPYQCSVKQDKVFFFM